MNMHVRLYVCGCTICFVHLCAGQIITEWAFEAMMIPYCLNLGGMSHASLSKLQKVCYPGIKQYVISFI